MIFEKKCGLRNKGYCYCCKKEVAFNAVSDWLRDHYLCQNCGCLPRERALMYCIEKFFKGWENYAIHESSPVNRGASKRLKREARDYKASQFFLNYPLGAMHPSGFMNQDLENQSYEDGAFDLVVTQDVMEHIFDPAKAFQEIARTLKHGGAHIFTVPMVNKEKPTEIWAAKNEDGTINYLREPEYHGNPVDDQGSLVTRHWGYDITDFIFKSSGLQTTIVYIDNIDLGIRAEFIEVLISRKY